MLIQVSELLFQSPAKPG